MSRKTPIPLTSGVLCLYPRAGCIYLLLVLLLAGFMIVNPSLTIKSSLDGLNLWFRVVLPALFPFFVVAELLVQLGFVHFLGVLLEPVMRPLFRLPGSSSFVVAMGFTSGFPIGAILTRRLYEDQMLDATEAERLVTFTNNASPLFMLGAVAVGMFGLPAAGYVIAGSHYLANLSVGFLWGRLAPARYAGVPTTTNLLHTALAKFLESNSDNRPGIGQMLGDSIGKSINSILTIGGFIIIFSVITQMLSTLGFIDILARIIQHAVPGCSPSYSLSYGLSIGVFEMTLGARAVASSEALLSQQLVAVSLVMAWSGLSIIAQVMSIVAGTPIRFSFYVLSRFIHMALASVYTLAGYHFVLGKQLTETTSTLPPTMVLPWLAPIPTAGLCLYPLIIALASIFILALTGLVVHRFNYLTR